MTLSTQEFFDMMLNDATAKKAKAAGQMTLGALMDALKLVPSDTPVRFEGGAAPGDLDSYRGIYAQLAVEPNGDNYTAASFLHACGKVLNKTLEGYKGGDFYMDRGTFLNVAHYGVCGAKLVGIEMRDGTLTLLTAEDEA